MAEQAPSKRKKVIAKLRNKFRLVIINDDTFEEKLSLLLSPLNVFTLVGIITILFAISLISLIAFTPLREFIPGYSDVKTKKMAAYAAFKADSLEEAINRSQIYLQNIKGVLEGNLINSLYEEPAATSLQYDTIQLRKSKLDSAIRKQVEEEDKFNIVPNVVNTRENDIASFFFFPPISGTITSTFNPSIKHYGIDVAAKENEAVKSVYQGTVILATWSFEDGNVIQIQHPNDLISVYKHNSALLKKTGDSVKPGEVIAIVGNSGENTTGPHLHFELWYKGVAVDPQNYIAF